MPMLSEQVRHLALIGDGQAIREAASKLPKKSAPNQELADVYELVAAIVEADFEAANVRSELITFKYAKSPNASKIRRILTTATAQINFAHGNFDLLHEIVERELHDFTKGKSSLHIGDILQLLRLQAGKHYILNEYAELRKIVSDLPRLTADLTNVHALYFSNAITCLSLSERGEFKAALKATKVNIELAKEHKYGPLFTPIDAMYVRADSFFAMSDECEGLKLFTEIQEKSKSISQWPWYFKAVGQIARQTAFKNQITQSLGMIREQRELLASFKFDNGLAFLVDANELFVRYLIKDQERIETLLARMPDLTLVRHMRALKDEWSGKDILPFIKKLPTESPREQIYKLFALAEYYKNNESQAAKYMQEALIKVEETGATEFLLRQHALFEIILKAVTLNPTSYLEDILRRMTERVKLHASYQTAGLARRLSSRELEILHLLATEATAKSIGESLNISMNTMKTHIRHIYQKLEVDTRSKAIAKAKELFII